MGNDKLQAIENKGFKRAIESKGTFSISPYKDGTEENTRFIKGYQDGLKSLGDKVEVENKTKDGFYNTIK